MYLHKWNIQEEINLSFKGVKFKHCGFTGNPSLFTLEQTDSFPLVRFDWQVDQMYFILSTLAVVNVHASSSVLEHLGYLFASHFLTDEQYHN